MSVAVEKTKILIVDIEMAMLNVLKNFSHQHEYNSKCYFDPAEACTALAHSKLAGESDYRCVLLGWPDGSTRIMQDLFDALASSDHSALPLVIVCHEVTAEIQQLAELRKNTHTVLWKHYHAAADYIARYESVPVETNGVAIAQAGMPQSFADNSVSASQNPINVLMLDNIPAVSNALRELMESNGYRVSMSGSAEDARKALCSSEYQLVLTDFFLRGEGGEDFCRFIQNSDDFPGARPVCVVVSSKHSDAIVRRSLAVGAIACLDKDESPELLFARVDALVAALPKADGSTTDLKVATNEMLELAHDPALVIDHQGLIAGLNRKAHQLLDDINRRDLIGRSFAQSVCRASIDVELKNTAKFQTSSGSEIVVTYMAQHISTGSHTGILLTFNPQPVRLSKEDNGSRQVGIAIEAEPLVNAPIAPDQPSLTAVPATATANNKSQSIVEYKFSPGYTELSLFTGMLERVARKPEDKCSYSVLMLDIELIAATDDRLSIGDSEPMLGIARKSLANFYTRDHALTYLGNGQFMYLFKLSEQQDSLALSRKLLQLVPQMVKYLSNMTLVSHASLLQLSADSSIDALKIINKCRRGAARARLDKRDNCALVLPMKKYLRASAGKDESARREKATSE